MIHSVQVFFSRIKWHGLLSLARTFIFLLLFQFVGISSTCFAQSHPFVDAVAEKIHSGPYDFLAASLWLPDSSLIFCDLDHGNLAYTIYQWYPGEDTARIYLSPSMAAAGLAFDLEGNVLMTQQEGLPDQPNQRIARLNKDGSQTEIVSTYDGTRLNGPAKLTVTADGWIYFTDPGFGPGGIANNPLPYQGIFVVNPEGKIWLLDKTLIYPTGIALSPDETKLYVTNSILNIFVWDIDSDTTITNKQIFVTMTGDGRTGGITVDEEGVVYAGGPGGIWIIDPDGSLIGNIPVPIPVNGGVGLNWGDPDGRTLYITTGGNDLHRLDPDKRFPNTTADTRTWLFLPAPSRIDSAFFVYNTGHAMDSIFITIDYDGKADSNFVYVDTTAFELTPGDSMKVTLTFDDSLLDPGKYGVNIIIESKYNPQIKEFKKRIIFQVITDIPNGLLVPSVFALEQNYPNPFNPETSIHFTVPKMSRVTLAIYDILGRKIRTLVNETKTAGSYNVTWNGKNNQGQPLASGLYFYKLQAGEFSATKKMMLLK